MLKEPDGPGHGAARPGARRLLFAAAGGLAIAIQIALLRELIVSLSGDETAVGIGLAAWLGGIAVGGAAGAWLLGRRGNGAAPGAAGSRGGPADRSPLPADHADPAPRRWAAGALALLALSGPSLILAGRWMRLALAPPPGELMEPGGAILLGAFLLAPPGLLVGLLFTALASAAGATGVAPGRGIASLYVFESLGSLAGGLAMTLLVIPFAEPLRGAALVGAGCLLLAMPSARAPAPRAPEPAFLPGRGLLAVVAIALVAISLPPLAAPLETASMKARFRALAPGIPLLDWIDTPYQHAELGGGGGVTHLYSGGQYAGSFPDAPTSETQAHTLACLAPHPARILAIGAVATGPLRFILRHPVEQVDIPEPDARFLRWLRRHLPSEDVAALDDPRVRIVPDDPRRFLATTPQRYDLILVLEPDPVTLLLARITTEEFYALAASRLAPEGTMVVGLRTAPNELTGSTAALAGAIFGALRSAFPVVHAGPGPDGLLVAGFDPGAVTLDPSILAGRWRARGIASGTFAPEMFGILFPAERVRAQEKGLEQAARAVAPSRDQRPVSFLYALARRETIAGGAAGRALAAIGRLPLTLLALLVLLPSAAVLGRAAMLRARGPGGMGEASSPPGSVAARADPDAGIAGRRALSIAAVHAVLVTGACGMTWSLLLLFSYQTRVGALYGRIGLLTALFMLGLAAGAAIAARFARGPRRSLLAACLGALLFALLLPAALALRVPGDATAAAGLAGPLYGGLLLLAGMATGAVFPLAAAALLDGGRGAEGRPGAAAAARAGGAIESADHAGAAVAAIAAALVVVPLFGVGGTALLLAGLQLLALAGVALTPRSRE